MAITTLGRILGALVVLAGCSSDSHTSHDAEAPDEGDAGALPDDGERWVKRLDGAYARLLGRPDGSVVVVTTTATQTRLRAFAPDGTESWSHGYDVTPFNLPFDAPEIAISPNNETYLSVNVSSNDGAALGDLGADCADGCSVVAAFDADGELRWSTARPAAQSRYLAALEDGVVVATIDLNTLPALTRFSSSGELAWQQPWPITDFWPAIIAGGAFAAGDGAGGFYLASTALRTGESLGIRTCGVITRYDAEQGEESWHAEGCGDAVDSQVYFSNVVALRDGAVAVLASGTAEPAVLSFAGTSEPRFSVPLAQSARLTPFDGAGLLAISTDSGPVAAVDDGGSTRWQWPGQLDDGALTAHPSGLCQGSAAMAPDGELYVLTRACAAARALLDVRLAEGEVLEDTWLLARLRIDRNEAVAPRCGNGWLDPGEACDGEDFAVPDEPRDGYPRPASCSSWLAGEGWSQAPTCTSACDVDLAACETTCGNGRLDEGESCDGEMFSHAQSCDEAELGSGPLGCDGCEVDLSVCPMRASCGNGMLEDWETCDGELSREPLPCDEGLPEPGLVGCMADCRERDYATCER
jgi:hypothetical protein